MKPIRYVTFAILLAVVVGAALGGCRSAKNAPAVYSPESGAVVASPTDGKADFDALCASYLPGWTDVTTNVRLQMSQPARFSGSARVTMRRGRWIHLSVRLLGFEVAAARIDADSVRGFVKTSKVCVAESLHSLLGSGEVTIADLQDLLMGRAFLAGTGGGTLSPAMSGDFEISEGGDFWMLQPLRQPAGVQYGFAVDYSGQRLLTALLDAARAQAAVTYSDTEVTPCGTFAGESALTVAAYAAPTADGPLNVEATLRWDFAGAKWDTGAEPQFRIPSGCRRIPASQLLRLLGNL